MDTQPYPLTPEEWVEIAKLPAVRDGWGIGEDEGPEMLASMVYAARFNFQSGMPGYAGDLFILQGDGLEAPMVLKRNSEGGLVPVR